MDSNTKTVFTLMSDAADELRTMHRHMQDWETDLDGTEYEDTNNILCACRALLRSASDIIGNEIRRVQAMEEKE